MLIDLAAAEPLLAELTRSAPLRVDAHALLNGYSFARHGHTVIGTVAVEGIKQKNRWHVHEPELRRAAAELTLLPLDLSDLVPVDLDWASMTERHAPAARGWRGTVRDMVCQTAVRAPGPLDALDLFEPGVTRAVRERVIRLLQEQRDWEARERDESASRSRRQRDSDIVEAGHPVLVHGTYPSDLIVRRERRWLLPRAYVDLLEHADSCTRGLDARAAACRRCGTSADDQHVTRHSSPTGWLTLCRSCTLAGYAVYEGHLDGVRYTSTVRRRFRADAYLCSHCATSPATGWDHCYKHGLVRSPLCGPCNTAEGVNHGWWLDRPEGVAHLLRCQGCRTEQTLPDRYHAELIRRHLGDTARHPTKGGRAVCRMRPNVQAAVLAADGTATFALWCPTHARAARERESAHWEVTVALRSLGHLVDAFLAPWFTDPI